MLPEQDEPVQLPTLDKLTLGALSDAIADRLALRLLPIIEHRPDARALALARLDLSTLSNLLDAAGAASDANPAIRLARKLAGRIAKQLTFYTTEEV